MIAKLINQINFKLFKITIYLQMICYCKKINLKITLWVLRILFWKQNKMKF